MELGRGLEDSVTLSSYRNTVDAPTSRSSSLSRLPVTEVWELRSCLEKEGFPLLPGTSWGHWGVSGKEHGQTLLGQVGDSGLPSGRGQQEGGPLQLKTQDSTDTSPGVRGRFPRGRPSCHSGTCSLSCHS